MSCLATRFIEEDGGGVDWGEWGEGMVWVLIVGRELRLRDGRGGGATRDMVANAFFESR